MQKRIPIKNHHREIILVTQRSVIASFFIGMLILLLIVRLAYLQIYKHDVYTTLATNNWLDLVPIEPTRGLIYDRKGVILAENIPVFSLDLIPNEITNMQATLKALSKLVALSENDLNQFKRQLKQHRRFDEIPLKVRLTEEEVARFSESQHHFPGVLIKARLLRYYPLGQSFSHVIGYVGRINAQELDEIDQANYAASQYIGKQGIEKYYEEELHGKVGYQQVENDASGKSIRILKDIKGIPGKNIYLTIDSQLQMIAEEAMGDIRGAIVVIQPSTGQVLAMVSKPGFDPNIFVQGISQKDYQSLQQSLDKPLYNRAIRGLYPLASTIKPYFALAGLEYGVVNPDYYISDPGWYELPNNGHVFHDWQHHGHGSVNLHRAIVGSCDTYFYELASKLGIQRMDTILTRFGFGELTGIDMDGELPGIVASPAWKRKVKGIAWYLGDTIISGIGQGFMQATPLQLAVAVSTLANRGQRYMPYLLLSEQLPGHPLSPQAPMPIDSVKLQESDTWEYVIQAMQEVVDTPQGTAFRFGQGRNYTVAAKTGTAQVVAKRGDPNKTDRQEDLPERFRDHHLFIAFAPADKPQIALAIITENSYRTIDVARIIFDSYLGKKTNANEHRTTEANNNKKASETTL